MSSMTDHIEGAFIIGCSRCANEGVSYAPSADEAEVEFRSLGWAYSTRGRPRLYCPQCAGDTAPAAVAADPATTR